MTNTSEAERPLTAESTAEESNVIHLFYLIFCNIENEKYYF